MILLQEKGLGDHQYFVSDDKYQLLAFIPNGGELKFFNKPMKFSTKGRSFKEISRL